MAYNTIQYQAHTEPVLSASVNFESNWHEPWSDPAQTIARKAIVGAFIALIASGPFDPPYGFTAPEVVTYDKWGYAWSEPIRLDLRKNLRTSAQQFLAFQLTKAQQPEQITESRWHQPWSEPVRFTIDRRLAIALAISGPFNPPYASQIEPGSSYTPWFNWLSEPVRLKPGLRSYLQQFYTTDTTAIPVSRLTTWFAPLADPVRVPARLATGAQKEFFYGSTSPIVSFAYYENLSEPKRFKRGLETNEQRTLFFDPLPIQNPVFVSSWFPRLSEPIRLPVGLKAWLQQFTAAPMRLLPNPNVTVIMNATETNTDTAQFAIYITNAAGGRTRVSIIEIPVPLNNPSSIRES